MPCIYVLEFPNGKKYVGQTIRTLHERWNDHVKTSRNPRSKGYNSVVYRAMRFHGVGNIVHRVLEEITAEPSVVQSILNEKEIQWIATLNTMTPNGYNATSGGCQGFICTEDIRRKISQVQKERYKNPEEIVKISQAAINRFANPEERKRQSQRMKARDTKHFRSCKDTKDLPKYVSIRRRSGGNRFIIIDHPLCKYKYFGVSFRGPNSTEISLHNCLTYLAYLDVIMDVKILITKVDSFSKQRAKEKQAIENLFTVLQQTIQKLSMMFRD
jgi:hypothetical protein